MKTSKLSNDDQQVQAGVPPTHDSLTEEVSTPVATRFDDDIWIPKNLCEAIMVLDHLQMSLRVEVLLPIRVLEDNPPAEAVDKVQVARHQRSLASSR